MHHGYANSMKEKVVIQTLCGGVTSYQLLAIMVYPTERTEGWPQPVCLIASHQNRQWHKARTGSSVPGDCMGDYDVVTHIDSSFLLKEVPALAPNAIEFLAIMEMVMQADRSRVKKAGKIQQAMTCQLAKREAPG